MPGDYSRSSLNPTKKYSAVLAQQGRVQVDADWNEQVALEEHRISVETKDTIGLCGTPKHEHGFFLCQTPRGTDLLIHPGHFYVSGLLCDLEPEKVQISFPAGSDNQITLPNLLLDQIQLATGQWLEIFADQKKKTLLVQITTTDPPSLTFAVDISLAGYQDAGSAWVRRAYTYTTQPFLPVPDYPISSPPNNALQLNDGNYLAYLKVWKREVNALQDPHIREVALGGPDTCTREQSCGRCI